MRRVIRAMALCAAVVLGLGLNFTLAQQGHGKVEHEHGQHGEEAGDSHKKADLHGGVVTMSKEFHVETVFMPDQVRLYLYDGQQNPIHVKHWKKGLVEATGALRFRDRGRGTATLKFLHAAPGGYGCPMHADQYSDKPGKCAKCDMKLAKRGIPDGTLWLCPMHPDENGKTRDRCSHCGMKYWPQDHLYAQVNLKGLEAGGAKVNFNLKNLPGTKERTLEFTQEFVPAKIQGQHKEAEHHGHEHGHEGHSHGD